ncbi:MAG: aminodeoxychorismate synthase component I, partial [Propionibacteriales bacterium]|nr:aminodeoxychorismate synthase component I [Propionibacteriales bacterium]
MTATPTARFDDTRTGTIWEFADPVEVITAHRVEEVVAALRRVEQAAASGLWCAGLVSYEAAPAFDSRLRVGAAPPGGPPLIWFLVCEAPSIGPGLTPPASGYELGDRQLAWSAADHRLRVQAVRQSIAAGDTYQCNLTSRLTGSFTGDPFGLYADLIMNQGGSYQAFLDLGRFAIASASPESFFTWHGTRVTCRPMKGTAPRGADPGQDADRRGALLASSKDRAENLMIVDLIRNDLSRVAVPGTVTVESLFDCEEYETVWQLTSTVSAEVPERTRLTDLFTALFPCGSVTGAPKISSMDLITDLEDSPRGAYCGAIGWVAPVGHPIRARFSVAIRTTVVDRANGTFSYGTGGGITWGSTPDAEWRELITKTRVLDHRDVRLLETMRCRFGTAQHLDRHLARLAHSAAFFGIGFDSAEARVHIAQRVSGVIDGRLRLLLDRSDGLDLEVMAGEIDTGAVVLAIDDRPVDQGSVWLRHKTT